MSAPVLDPATALVVVDLQPLTLAHSAPLSGPDLLAACTRLATAAADAGALIVVAVSTGTPPGRTAHGAGGRQWPAEATTPALTPPDGADVVHVGRPGWSAFAGTDLDTTLRGRGVTRVLICGIATSFGVESTARQAYDLGYDVLVAVDAVSDRDPGAHQNTIDRVLPALGATVTTADLLVG